MAPSGDWRIPQAVQPKTEDYAYDLDRALSSIVALRATIPNDAFTAETLGTERAGHGVVIREDGVVLTIGYLITEAEAVWLTTNDGRVVPADVLAYDQVTGFGLLQPLARLELPLLPMGTSLAAKTGERVVLAGAGGAITPYRRASSPSRSLRGTGNTCSTKRSSRRRPIPIGAELRSSAPAATFSESDRFTSSRPARRVPSTST